MKRIVDPAKMVPAADWLAVAIAISLPWSTSVTAILVALWAIAAMSAVDFRELKRVALTPEGGLPLLLVALGVVGMLWADVTFKEKLSGIGAFLKLLLIPLLFTHFRRSERGLYVFAGFAASCVVLLFLSGTFALWPQSAFMLARDKLVPVKNAATQSGEFVASIFSFLYLAFNAYQQRKWPWLIALAALILGMLASIFFVAAGRTAVLTIPVLLALFALRTLNLRAIVVLVVCTACIGAAAWFSSPYLRVRVTTLWTDLQRYEETGARNSSGERAEFYKKSIAFIREAPVIGHGTGSIHALFKASSEGQTGAAGSATANPHNQTFAVAIQLGLIGAAVLWAVWIAHLLLFRGGGFADWIGLMLVAQNIFGSLFNSHLFDFVQGWIYVLGIGVAGGMVMKARALGDAPKP